MDEKQQERISLYLYNELDEAEREELEREIESSSELAAAVESERAFLNTLSARESLQAPDGTLAELRHDLMREVYRDGRSANPAPQGGFPGWWANFMSGLGGFRVAWQPTAALALLALGFWGGRMTQSFRGSTPTDLAGGASSSTPIEGAQFVSLGSDVQDVHSIDVDPEQGQVEIIVEERRTIRGNPNNPVIRDLLVSSVRSSNSGNRLTSIDALRPRTSEPEIRRALTLAMLDDPNPGVRLKALASLAPFSVEPEVRRALMTAVRQDDNAGMRVRAIELLTANPDRELVGLLQTLVREDTNEYVQLRSQQALQKLDASIEQF